jgi:V/A-type H+-transporting ATPase subunit A
LARHASKVDVAGEATVTSVRESLVSARLVTGAVRRNEVAYVHCAGTRLRSEVLRVEGDRVALQVFEDTQGVRVGDMVEFSGEMLSAVLGPGLLGQVYDGLQNPLSALADRHGFFMPRGAAHHALDAAQRWAVVPAVKPGARVAAGDRLGSVQEGHIEHALIVPPAVRGIATVDWIQGGPATLHTPIAGLTLDGGEVHEVTLATRWPVRRPYGAAFETAGRATRVYPDQPLTTSMRLIDTFFPIARGGTACIPGPFGAGKTVLQGLIARYADVDVVVIVACGERAGEVVETLTTFPQLADPRTGGTLMDRTVIVCNTSSMPVAARESSVYLGLTVAEYYRQMGLHTLVLADSTSRWAQALREISGLMEEIPGEEAFPAYLDSSIKALYERAGAIRTPEGKRGSLTLIGTVSPAGGNFEEPVTQSTLGTVKCFLGLSSDRAYRRLYPAVDPLLSWSRYFDQLRPWLDAHHGAGWVARVQRMAALIKRGDEVAQMMRVTGEEGVAVEDYATWLAADLVDSAFLQQDAYDPVDASTPRERQTDLFGLLERAVHALPEFADRDAARAHFTRLKQVFRNLNYSPADSDDFARWRVEIEGLVAPRAEGEKSP